MRCFIVLAISLSMAVVLFAQPSDSLWSRVHGGNGVDYHTSIQQTSDDGFILGGHTNSFSPGNRDFWLMKTDANGDSLWSRVYGGSLDEYCTSVLQTDDGGFLLGGFSYEFLAEDHGEIWLVKTNGSGDTLWCHTYARSDEDYCYSIQQTQDGGYILLGNTLSGESDFWLVKTDSDGNELWNRAIGQGDADYGYSVRQTSDGGYILGGYTYTSGSQSTDLLVIKTDTNGSTRWTRRYGGDGSDYCFSVQQTTDGGYILGGYTTSFGAGNSDFWLLKLDADGDSLWSRTYGGSDVDRCYSVQQTTDGGYVLGGFTESFGTSGTGDFWLVKTNAEGDSLWSMALGGTGDDACGSVKQTSDGGYILAGYTESYGMGNTNGWLVKIGPDPLYVEDGFNPQPSSFDLAAFPNPFNASTTISFTLPRAGEVTMTVYDVMGRLVDGQVRAMSLQAGEHRAAFDGAGLASGIYFVRMEAGALLQTQKIVLLK